MPTTAQRKRRKSGERRVESLLAAAEEIFADTGYDNATTNQIAARAGASPGTLYQFFPNKTAIARTLALRYAAELADIHRDLFGPKSVHAPVALLTSRIVDTHLAFRRRRPGFEAILNATTLSPDVSRELLDGLIERFVAALLIRAPYESKARMTTVAEMCVMAFRGALHLLSQYQSAGKARIVKELKTLLERYLEPIAGKGRSS